MIGMLRGKVWEIQGERLVIDVQGVGYILAVPLSLLAKVRPGQDLVVYTHLIPREDELSLYGFANAGEKELFLEMLSVSGIGPKAAISLLSTLGVSQIQSAVATENVTMLTKVPGIGKKTAQRIVLELKEKFKAILPSLEEPFIPGGSNVRSDALETLLALGFSLQEAQQALRAGQAEGQESNTEEQVKRALRYLAG